MSEKSELEIREELSFGSFFKLLWLKRTFIIKVVLFTVVLVMGYSFIAPFKYKSAATLLPPDNAGGMGDLTSFLQTLSGGLSFGTGGQSNQLLIFQEILKSREAAKIIAAQNNLVEKLDVDSANIEELYGAVSSMLDVELQRSGLILITSQTSTSYFPSGDDKSAAAELSAALINSSIAALDSVNRFKSISKAKRKREFIEKVLAGKNKELDSIDRTVEAFRAEHNIYSIEDQNQAIMNNAVTLGSELARAEIELNLKRLDYDETSPIVMSAKRKYEGLLEQYRRIQTGGIASSDEFSIPLDSIPRLIRVYQDLMRGQKILEQVKLYLETQRYQEAIQEESDVPTVEALDLAQVPRHRISPNRKVMLILAFFMAAVGAASWVLIRGIYRGNLWVRKDGFTEPK